MKFKPHEMLLHVKTGRTYVVVIAADHCRLEATGEPAYAYKLARTSQLTDDPVDDPTDDPTVWVRAAAEMEDGRFVPAPA